MFFIILHYLNVALDVLLGFYDYRNVKCFERTREIGAVIGIYMFIGIDALANHLSCFNTDIWLGMVEFTLHWC